MIQKHQGHQFKEVSTQFCYLKNKYNQHRAMQAGYFTPKTVSNILVSLY